MSEQTIFEQLETAVMEWAQENYQQDDIIVHLFHDDDDDPDRFVAVLAVRDLDGWQAVEVWLERDQVVSITDLGEGMPPEDTAWPWDDPQPS